MMMTFTLMMIEVRMTMIIDVGDTMMMRLHVRMVVHMINAAFVAAVS